MCHDLRSLAGVTVYTPPADAAQVYNPSAQMCADETKHGRKGFPMIKYGTHVFFVRERNGYFWLVDDGRPEVAIRLPGVTCEREAERMAWTLING